MTARAEQIAAMIEPVLAALGLQLWGIEYLGQGRHTLLRVYIEKPQDGVDIEDCAEASRQISAILDVEDPIKEEYTLEVSSPGVERMLFTLEQYRQYLGTELKLRLRQNFEGRRHYGGVLAEVGEDEVALIVGEDKISFPLELIEKANVVYRGTAE
ncbi:MAG TPA: ribosome maturation factor RimP [Hyphomicrobiales bacterium]|nr:ribosome maturation factor RimP [Hyphomicrobiales bacterium]